MQSNSINIGRDFNGSLHNGDQFIYHNYSSEDYKEIVSEVRSLLIEISASKYTGEIHQASLIAQKLNESPNFFKRIQATVQAMGIQAFEEAVDHPLANVLLAGLQALREI